MRSFDCSWTPSEASIFLYDQWFTVMSQDHSPSTTSTMKNANTSEFEIDFIEEEEEESGAGSETTIDESTTFDDLFGGGEGGSDATEQPQDPVENPDNAATTPDENTDGKEPVVSKYTIGEKEYTQEELSEALKARDNMVNWQKANTKRAQELAEKERLYDERLKTIERLNAPQQKPSPEAQLTPEETQALNTLKTRFGLLTKAEVETMFNERVQPLNQSLEKIASDWSTKEILSEMEQLQKQRNITEEATYDVIEFAEKNNLTHLKLDDVYVLMNKDNIFKSVEAEAQAKAAKDAARKASAGKVVSTKGVTPGISANPLKYDSEKDKGLSMNQLLQRAKQALSK